MAGELLSEVELTRAGDLRAALVVPPEHPVLAGHFPGAPLVPGVLLLGAVAEAYGGAVGVPHHLVAVDDVRFTAPLPPGERATLAATCAPEDGGVRIDGEWRGAAGRLAAFRVQLRPRA